MIDREHLSTLMARERERFRTLHPRSAALAEKARAHMPDGVPMSWMAKWPGGFPIFVSSAKGAHFRDVDGIDYIDLCLGDTGSMTGHSPEATVAAIHNQIDKGITMMLPSEDAIVVSEELARRFGLPLWQFTVSATDANRHVIRYSRMLTGRPKIVVIDRCYHGSVDETFATLDNNHHTVAREGNIGAPVPLDVTTTAVEFNDLGAMERALKTGDIAAILLEPAMTNVGIVLPEPGYLEELQKLARQYGAYLILDETHTISYGPGGMTGALGLKPDFLTIGKAIGGGIPTGTFGMTQEIAAKIREFVKLDLVDTGGVGGTLAGNALSLAAMRATLTEVLTEQAYARMIPLADRWANGVEEVVREFALSWHVNRLGARAEYTFTVRAPRTGREAANAEDFELEQYLHLYLLNEGFLLTPFHNMALISPDATEADIDAHTRAFRNMCRELVQK
ncbi:MAG: aspartate aminotransferase family protein [Actinobacteria bacterium]|uniref:Aspartate aminotransferase family protein n=1 Tax=Candidatus Fonsibacter lacus TaxID=2576439 RepID=A0A965GD52_9PROT|nr:aspartate aminotransferase family protein [Candidatus Fonsibacter lacus]